MGRVEHLFQCLVHRFPMRELEVARAIGDKGIEGCIHGRVGSKRQVLLMESETLEKLAVKPGAVKENITTRGIAFNLLAPGQRLRVGESLLEITVACEPCLRMNEIRAGLEEELRGQRGWLCRVLNGGVIRPGDAIDMVNLARAESQYDNRGRR
jgi:MOSC domain-containing protein YiiM